MKDFGGGGLLSPISGGVGNIFLARHNVTASTNQIASATFHILEGSRCFSEQPAKHSATGTARLLENLIGQHD